MFIVVRFGFYQHQYYAIESLTASLSDRIFKDCLSEMIKYLHTQEREFNKELDDISKKIPVVQSKIDVLDLKIKELEGDNPVAFTCNLLGPQKKETTKKRQKR